MLGKQFLVTKFFTHATYFSLESNFDETFQTFTKILRCPNVIMKIWYEHLKQRFFRVWILYISCVVFLYVFLIPYIQIPIIVAHYQGHKPIHWKTRRAGNDNVYTGLTQYTVNVIQNQREVRYVHQILFPIRYFWHPIPPFKTHTQFKDSPPCCSPLCNTTKTNMAPI